MTQLEALEYAIYKVTMSGDVNYDAVVVLKDLYEQLKGKSN